jgi:hypothetical protein
MANSNLLELFRKSQARFRYHFQWQALAAEGADRSPASWNNLSPGPLANNIQGFNVKWKDIKPNTIVALRCFVSLQHYREEQRSQPWEDVMTYQKISLRGDYTRIPVKWLVDTPSGLADADNVRITFRPGQAAPTEPLLRGAQAFLDMRTQIDRLVEMYKNLPTPKPVPCFVNPAVVSPSQGQPVLSYTFCINSP